MTHLQVPIKLASMAQARPILSCMVCALEEGCDQKTQIFNLAIRAKYDCREAHSEHVRAPGRKGKDANQPGRDEFLRPMVDATGIKYRIGLSEDDMTEDIREEFEENQQESWAGLRFAGGRITISMPGCSLLPVLVFGAAWRQLGLDSSRLSSDLTGSVWRSSERTALPFALSTACKAEGLIRTIMHRLCCLSAVCAAIDISA